MTCPKCESPTELGFIFDENAHASPMQIRYEGVFRRTFWGARLSKRRKFAVQTARCTACGYLESYAK